MLGKRLYSDQPWICPHSRRFAKPPLFLLGHTFFGAKILKVRARNPTEFSILERKDDPAHSGKKELGLKNKLSLLLKSLLSLIILLHFFLFSSPVLSLPFLSFLIHFILILLSFTQSKINLGMF